MFSYFIVIFLLKVVLIYNKIKFFKFFLTYIEDGNSLNITKNIAIQRKKK